MTTDETPSATASNPLVDPTLKTRQKQCIDECNCHVKLADGELPLVDMPWYIDKPQTLSEGDPGYLCEVCRHINFNWLFEGDLAPAIAHFRHKYCDTEPFNLDLYPGLDHWMEFMNAMGKTPLNVTSECSGVYMDGYDPESETPSSGYIIKDKLKVVEKSHKSSFFKRLR